MEKNIVSGSIQYFKGKKAQTDQAKAVTLAILKKELTIAQPVICSFLNRAANSNHIAAGLLLMMPLKAP